MKSRIWHTPAYKAYINPKNVNSPWHTRKSAYWKTHKRRCVACGRFGMIHLHHASYDYGFNGTEPDEILFPLCAGRRFLWLFRTKGCHGNVHEAFNSGRFKTLQEATLYMVNWQQRWAKRWRLLKRLLRMKCSS